jgi:hypothetical protein
MNKSAMKKLLILLLILIPILGFATDSTVTVKPSGQGGDYTTIDAAIDDQVANWPDLTSDCNDTGSAGILTISIEGTWSAADTAAVTISGFTTSSSYYLKIVADSNNKASKDGWKTDRYQLVYDGEFVIGDDYVRLDGLQIKSNNDLCIRINATDGEHRYSNLRIDDNGQQYGIYTNQTASPGMDLKVWNTIIENGVNDGIYYRQTGGGTADIYNSVIYNFTDDGLENVGSTMNATNCAVFTNGTDFAGTITVIRCASDDGDGSNPVSPYGSDWDNEFVDSANGDFTIVDSGNCVAAGQYDPGSGLYSDDMEGDTRAGTATPSWDIGVDETDTILRYVDTDAGGTGDGQSWTNAYITLQGWETGEQGILTTLGKISRVLCRASSGTADNTATTITGWTTGASYYILIEAASGDEAVKTGWDASRYRLAVSNASTLWIEENYVRLSGLQIDLVASNGNGQSGVYISGQDASNTIYIYNSRIQGNSGASYSNIGIREVDLDINLDVWNTIVTDFDGHASSVGIQLYGADSDIYNSVVYKCTDGIKTLSGDLGTTVTNTASFNCGDDFDDSGSSLTVTYSASDDSQAGTGNIQPASWANEFSNAAGGNFTLVDTGAECYHAGANNPSSGIYTTDMEGDAYNTGTDGSAYSIGVDEYIGAITWRHHTTLGFAMVFDFIYSVLALYKAHMWIVFSVWAFMAVWATIKFIGRDR